MFLHRVTLDVPPHMKKPVVVNLFGGPGIGKSTTAAEVFATLKHMGINVELVTEFAKDMVWEKSVRTLDNQIFVFANQHHRLWRLRDQVDVIVTDSPLLLSLYYGNEESETFEQLVLEEFNRFTNFNVLLQRTKPYNPAGRLQTEVQAKQIDDEVRRILTHTYQEFLVRPADRLGAVDIAYDAHRILLGLPLIR